MLDSDVHVPVALSPNGGVSGCWEAGGSDRILAAGDVIERCC